MDDPDPMDLAAFLARLDALAARLPEAERYLMHDHPSYRAGKKCFAIVGDREGTVTSLSIKVPLMDQPLYCQVPRFSITHYIGHHGWITLDLTGSLHWPEVERLVVDSYKRAALKRMLAKLAPTP